MPPTAGGRAPIAVRSRLRGDAALQELLVVSDGNTKVVYGPPGSIESEALFPRISFTVVNDDELGPDCHKVRMSVETQAWPTGPNGGFSRLYSIEARLLYLIRGQSWTDDGYRFTGSVASAGRDLHPAGADPAARLRDFYVLAQRA